MAKSKKITVTVDNIDRVLLSLKEEHVDYMNENNISFWTKDLTIDPEFKKYVDSVLTERDLK
ncbi:hypothetical protein NVP1170O_150 [Vibrio phage 1.170.O._10N.261.52.C3]|nr:hypothetical protein NVP1170O_150 [Vibrio phage 1.170.O._10N.261.52.C3]